ncbi:TonB-dependent receptor [Haliangium sp.]|uniref:TonB-dependent receptor n=1 Tax=Haliangium sp. TaxID=2663208 RepID=UPI003D0D700D
MAFGLAFGLAAVGSPARADTPVATDQTTTAVEGLDRGAPVDSDERDLDDPALVDALIAAGEVVLIESEAPTGPGTATGRSVDQVTIARTAKHSADDLLRLVPGLHLSRHGSEGKAPQIFLRGFDAVHGADVEVEVAGIAINEMSNVHGHGYVDIGFVIPEVVRSLEARKGSFELDQGDFATAGSVAFTLGVAGVDRGARLGYEAGTSGRHRVLAVVAPEGAPEASFAAVEALSDQGFGQARRAERATALGQHRVDLGPGRFLELVGGAYAARFDEPAPVPVDALESGEVGFYDILGTPGRGGSYRALAGVRVHGEDGVGRWDARAHLSRRGLDLDENYTGALLYPEMGDRRSQRHRSTSGAGELGYERDVSAAVTLLAGVGARFDRLSQGEQQLDRAGLAWRDNRALSALALGGDARAGVRLRLGSSVRAEAGVRADALRIATRDRRTGARGDEVTAALSPRITTAWTPAPGWTLFGAYGRGLRSPEAQAAVAAAAMETGPEVTPSPASEFTTTDAVELGVRGRLGDRLSLGAGGFGVWIDREVLFDHLSGRSLAMQATRRLGLELDATYRPLPWLSLRADVAAVDARFTGSGSPIPGVPRLMAALVAGAAHAGWHGSAQLRYLAPRPLANGATGSAVHVLDLTGGLRLGRFDVGVQVDNALARDWREGEYHYASWFDEGPPRSRIPRLHYTAGRPFGIRASVTTWF